MDGGDVSRSQSIWKYIFSLRQINPLTVTMVNQNKEETFSSSLIYFLTECLEGICKLLLIQWFFFRKIRNYKILGDNSKKYLKKTTSIYIFLGITGSRIILSFIIFFSGLAWIEDNILDWMGNRNYTAEVIQFIKGTL